MSRQHGRWILVILSAGLSACSLMQRHPRSGYYDSGYESSVSSDLYQDRAAHERDQTREELGLENTRELTDQEQNRLMDRVELNRLERRLDAQREKKQYYTHKPHFNDDRERIYFLRLAGFEARERYLRAKGISPENEVYQDEIADLIEQSDVAVGMSKKAVQESWGDPDIVEVAGDPVYGNERWKYGKMISTASGYNKEMRVIYFESGRVVGWERQ